MEVLILTRRVTDEVFKETNMTLRSTLFCAALLSGAAPVFACATCGCSLSSDAATGYSNDPGWQASLQFDYIDQRQLRSGTHVVSAAEIAAINNAGGDQEVEHDTVNRTLTFGLSYSPDADWGVRVLVPYVDRGHSTYGSSSNPLDAAQLSGAKITGLGDVRLLATWQGLLPGHNLGLQVGVKLPTGRYGGPDADGTGVTGRHPTAFRSGPLSQQDSPDNLVDASLQPGTGSTDLLLGAFYHQAVSREVDAFVNLQYQAAVSERLHASGADFRPGNTIFVSLGARYQAAPGLVPQVQVNLSHKGADGGALADGPDSAGTTIYLSPGLAWSPQPRVQLFGFAQLPVHSNLAGYQLAPRWTASGGVSVGF
jgi:hypothetical protein